MLKKIIFFITFTIVCAFAETTFVDLEVSDKKVIGRAKGLLSDREILRKQSLAAAKGEADILVETDFFYEEYGDSLRVTVTGFPANYAAENSANSTSASENSEKTEVKTDTEPKLQAPPSVSSVSAEDDKQKDAKQDAGLYVSLKAVSSIPWSSIGGNVQVGYFADKIFMGVDFGAGKGDGSDNYDVSQNIGYNYYCGGVSFARRIKPNEFFQVVVGGNTGAYSKFEDEKRDFVFGYGPFAKFIFGNTKIKMEASGKIIIGYSYASINTEVGITYAP